MKTGMKQILSALVFLSALTGCKIEDPDFFVPEVAFAAAEKEVVFEPAGGTESFSVEANCDWSVSCPAEWVTLSVEAGDRNGTVEIAVKPTKLPRNTTITLYSNEVESRTSVIAVVQKGVVEIRLRIGAGRFERRFRIGNDRNAECDIQRYFHLRKRCDNGRIRPDAPIRRRGGRSAGCRRPCRRNLPCRSYGAYQKRDLRLRGMGPTQR